MLEQGKVLELEEICSNTHCPVYGDQRQVHRLAQEEREEGSDQAQLGQVPGGRGLLVSLLQSN